MSRTSATVTTAWPPPVAVTSGSARALSWPEAALLAGLVQGPSADDPLQHPVRARRREEHVFGRLVATGKLTQPQASAALAQPMTRLVADAGAGNRCAA
jgi:membrane peptidoglycan carboxypeptidase